MSIFCNQSCCKDRTEQAVILEGLDQGVLTAVAAVVRAVKLPEDWARG